MKAARAFGAKVDISPSHRALAAGRAALGTFVGAATALTILASAAAAADSRTIDLYNVHTKERLTITFKKDGRFIPAALAELNRFLRDWRRNEATRMDPRLFDTVWELYQKSGSRQPIHVVCGYRSLATNNMLRSRSSAVAKHSQHTLGRAMDMNIPDVSVDKLRLIAVQMQNGGVGWYPSANSPFVHIDVGSVRAWPRLSRTQLVGLFPDGKTAHIPTDGKPLPGYSQALAELQRDKGAAPAAMASAAPAAGKSGKGGGLLAMLFSNDEEDSAEEIGSAGGDDDAPAVAAKPAPVAPKAAPPAAVAATPPAAAAPPPPAPVLTAAFAPRPAAAPERPVTSLAEATLPAGLEPVAVPKLTGADRLAMDNVPLPQAKPSEIAGAAVELAMLSDPVMLPPDKPPAPVEAPLPPAAARQDAIAAQLALAEVAQEEAPTPAALSFAAPADTPLPPAAARSAQQTAALVPAARKATPPAPATELSRPLIDGGKSDMFGNLELPEIASEDGPLLLDGGQSVYWGRFRTLIHPDQVHLAALFEAPIRVEGGAFSAQPYGALVSTRFAGPVTAPTEIIDFTPRQLAMR
jgi:uncharacterized protein YcbK (DUF882 family)